MLNRFLSQAKTPPGGRWFYVVPETGVFFDTAASMRALISAVTRHYEGNHIQAPGNLEELIEDHICQHVDASFCLGTTAGQHAGLTFHEISARTEQLVRNLRGRGLEAYVAGTEAERRAAICMVCPAHDLRHCVSCDGLQQTFLPSVGYRSTSRDNMIRACGVTGAVLTVQVHLNREVVSAHAREGKEFPDTCWAARKVADHADPG